MDGICGFSLYMSTPFEQNLNIVKRFSNAGFQFVFTSLNISEEICNFENMNHILDICKQNNLYVIVDINDSSLKKFGLNGLIKLGVRAVRLDDCISHHELIMLAQQFDIVLNASTLSQELLEELTKTYEVNPKKLIACHNYYPKEYTGISLESFREKNELCQRYGIKTVGFVSGEIRRFPIYQGLPTIEEHRYQRPLYAALECMVDGKCNAICIGDVDVSDETLHDFKYLSKNIVPLCAKVGEPYKSFVFENRRDSSEYVIRAAFSRTQLMHIEHFGECMSRQQGCICVANEKYERYQYELEICLVDLPEDVRQTTVGFICDEDIKLLKFIKYPFLFQFT